MGSSVGPGDGWNSVLKAASVVFVEAANSVRCLHAHVTLDAVDATAAQPSVDQLAVALSRNEHEAALAGQLTVTSSGRTSPVTVVVDPSGSVTS